LALVRDIAERQGGRVRVESTGPTGTMMTLEIPVAR
jgi:two-component system, OmpR family, sensor kinase